MNLRLIKKKSTNEDSEFLIRAELEVVEHCHSFSEIVKDPACKAEERGVLMTTAC